MISKTLAFTLAILVFMLVGCVEKEKNGNDLVPAGAQSKAGAPGAAAGALSWPRTYQGPQARVLMYQPQVDAWKDFDKIRFRAALVVSTPGSTQPAYGVIAVQADTLVDNDNRTVLMTNLDIAYRFPGLADERAAALRAAVESTLPTKTYLDVPLDDVLSYLHDPPKLPKVELSLEPPPIYYSGVPAILVIYMGQPQFRPISGTQLMFAVNTNWAVLMDTSTSKYYLLDGESWLTSSDPLKGPWTAAPSLPADFSKLPSGGNWDEVRKNMPGKPITAVPRVLTSTEPAELIVTEGPPAYTPIPGTRLMYVSNPEMTLFLDVADSNYYFLVAGRWFRAANLNGPWSAASANLPAEFARIPADGPMGSVLASIPNTQEASDAILLASVPHKATITIADATVNVTYEGTPKFVPIQGTSMTYAANTSYQVLLANNMYYCCQQGVWFMSPAATGPWVVCISVPTVIYTIPPSCPLYNVTYVQVYSSTPTTVVVGYTSGYSGEYVAATGALMFGAGMIAGAVIADNNNWYCCSPCYYSYGCAAHYSYAYGGYFRAGGSYYGPAGGCGWGSSYNAATGTWARGAYATTAGGSRWGEQAYNPFTNTFAQHTGGTNGYKSWGSSYVSQGNKWAEAGHESNAFGSAGYAQNSSGQWAQGAHSNLSNSSVARTSNGDLYAGHDGNVYKNTDGSWQKYSGGGNWDNTAWNKPASSEISSAGADSSWQNSFQNHTQSSAADSAAKSDWNSSSWKSSWDNTPRQSSFSNAWSQHDTLSGLNSDSWSRDRSSGFSGFSGGGFGGGSGRFGGGGLGGGRFGGFRR